MDRVFGLVELATGASWGELTYEDDYKECIVLYDDGRVMLITEVRGEVYINPVDTRKWQVVWK